MNPDSILYITNDKIDRVKWDACIEKAANGLIYAYSWWLDRMAEHWDALVLNNYETVMPLTWRKKWGITYLYQPFLTPQLGIIGNNITTSSTKAFLAAVPTHFRFWDINLNTGNTLQQDTQECKIQTKVNYLLSLQNTYTTLEEDYRQNHKRNIKKAIKLGCIVKKHIPLQNMIQLAQQQLDKYTRYSDKDISNFTILCEMLLQQGKAVTYGVYLREQLLASCIFLFDNRQAYYILAGNHSSSRTSGASHLLLDSFIHDEAGKKYFLNFVGSDFKNIAFFYEGYGATIQAYPSVHLNRLPFFLRWLKK